MHSKSYNEEIMTTFDTEQTTEELSHLLLQRCEVGLEQTMKDSLPLNMLMDCFIGAISLNHVNLHIFSSMV